MNKDFRVLSFLNGGYFSFYRAPIKNTQPCREINLLDLHTYLISEYARTKANKITSDCHQSSYRIEKATFLDYVTPHGVFTKRSSRNVVSLSGFAILDYDHVEQLSEHYFSCIRALSPLMAFISPSGEGFKLIVDLRFYLQETFPYDLFLDNGTLVGKENERFQEVISNWFTSAYSYYVTYDDSLRSYMPNDQSGKDIARACFLPCDLTPYISTKRILDFYEK